LHLVGRHLQIYYDARINERQEESWMGNRRTV